MTIAFLTLAPGRSRVTSTWLVYLAMGSSTHLRWPFQMVFLATKATCSSPVYSPDSIYSRGHTLNSCSQPWTPTGSSESCFLQPRDTAGAAAPREELPRGRWCLPKSWGRLPGGCHSPEVFSDTAGDPAPCPEDTVWAIFSCQSSSHVHSVCQKSFPPYLAAHLTTLITKGDD